MTGTARRRHGELRTQNPEVPLTLAPWPLLSALGYLVVATGAANNSPIFVSAAANTPGVTPGKFIPPKPLTRQIFPSSGRLAIFH